MHTTQFTANVYGNKEKRRRRWKSCSDERTFARSMSANFAVISSPNQSIISCLRRLMGWKLLCCSRVNANEKLEIYGFSGGWTKGSDVDWGPKNSDSWNKKVKILKHTRQAEPDVALRNLKRIFIEFALRIFACRARWDPLRFYFCLLLFGFEQKIKAESSL